MAEEKQYTEIVLNCGDGGFSLSNEALELYNKLTGPDDEVPSADYIERNDPILVQVVKTLGEKANGPRADLYIKHIEVGTKYRIDNYNGDEIIETIDSIIWEIA